MTAEGSPSDFAIGLVFKLYLKRISPQIIRINIGDFYCAFVIVNGNYFCKRNLICLNKFPFHYNRFSNNCRQLSQNILK